MKKSKVLSYYSFENAIGGPRTYIRTLEESELSNRYDFVSCYQNEAPKGISFSLLMRMIKSIKQHNPDIVHVHGAQSEGFYGVLASHLAGCHNVLLTIHGFAHDDFSCTGIKYLLYRFFVEPVTLLFSKRIYTVCYYAAKRPIVRLYGGRRCIGHIHNPATKHIPQHSRDEMREKLGIAHDHVVLSIVSRITKDKGFKILEEIIRRLNIEYSSRFSLLVIGDGEYLEEFKVNLAQEISSNQVHIAGRSEDVASYLSASDIFVFPSLHENLSIALLEAAQAGLACVVSDVGGNGEIIRDRENGILVQSTDIQGYVDGIIELIKNENLRRELGKAAEQSIRSNFSINDFLNKVDSVYSSLSGL